MFTISGSDALDLFLSELYHGSGRLHKKRARVILVDKATFDLDKIEHSLIKLGMFG
jgi:hypothetical protein